MDQCVTLIGKPAIDQQLFELMSNPDRCFTWDFRGPWNARGAIGFRQDPGVTSSGHPNALAKVKSRAKDSAKINGIQPVPFGGDQEKRYEQTVKNKEKKNKEMGPVEGRKSVRNKLETNIL